jgi:hypothetical protein
MPRVGFEATIPVFEREKTVHASDRAATVIEKLCVNLCYVDSHIDFCLKTNITPVVFHTHNR